MSEAEIRVPKIPKRHRAWGEVAVGLIGTCLLSVLLFHWAFYIPSDQELANYFFRHKETYVALMQMIHKDGHVRGIWQDTMSISDPRDPDSSDIPKPPKELGFPNDRFIAYRRLLDRVDARMMYQDEDNSVLISRGGHSFASSGPEWGYIWLPKAPPLETTDSTGERDRTYLPLGDNWYILRIF